jgi:hypothetical protein
LRDAQTIADTVLRLSTAEEIESILRSRKEEEEP